MVPLDYTTVALGLILAAGRGTRMGPLGEQLPKPLLYLPGATLLDYQLELLARCGVGHVYVVVGHHAEQVAAHLHRRPGVELLYQEEPFTLWGALWTARAVLDGPCLVLHGDNYLSFLPLELLRALEESPAVFYRGEVGVYGLRAEMLAQAGPQGSLESLRVGARRLPLPGWQANVNAPRDLLEVHRRLLDGWHQLFHPASADPGYLPAGRAGQLQPPCWVSPRARLAGASLGPYVTVGAGAVLRDVELSECVVFPGARLAGTRLRRALVVGRTTYPT